MLRQIFKHQFVGGAECGTAFILVFIIENRRHVAIHNNIVGGSHVQRLSVFQTLLILLAELIPNQLIYIDSNVDQLNSFSLPSDFLNILACIDVNMYVCEYFKIVLEIIF